MTLDSIILIFTLLGFAVIIFLLIKLKTKNDETDDNKKADELANLNAEIIRLKDSLNSTINSSLGSMSNSFNNLSTGVTRDMTNALTKVDEKVVLRMVRQLNLIKLLQ